MEITWLGAKLKVVNEIWDEMMESEWKSYRPVSCGGVSVEIYFYAPLSEGVVNSV